MQWGGFETILAIAQKGSLSGAARLLKVSHATVFRRLNAIEDKLGVALFERSRTGYTPTLSGEELVTTALRIESEVLSVERKVTSRDLQPCGEVGITTTDALLVGLLSPLFARFRADCPGIALDVVVSNQLFNPTRREADVAIRPTNSPPEALIGSRLATIGFAVFGHQSMRNDQGILDIYRAPWIGPGSRLEDQSLVKWMALQQLDEQCSFRVDSLMGMLSAVRAGLGVAVLPCYLGAREPGLVQLTAPIPELNVGLWFLMHPDLRGVARIQALMTFLSTAIADQAVQLEGQV